MTENDQVHRRAIGPLLGALVSTSLFGALVLSGSIGWLQKGQFAAAVVLSPLFGAAVVILVAHLARCRFRFSLRTLFVVLTLSAVLTAWLGWNWKRVQERRMAPFDYPIYSLALNREPEPQPKPPLLWRLLGAQEVHVIYMQLLASPQQTERVQDLFPEAEIRVRQQN